MRNRKGTLLIGIGLLLMAAALFLTGYNLWEDYCAGESAQTALAQLETGLEETGQAGGLENGPHSAEGPDGGKAGSMPDVEPDYVRYPEMEMPVQQIDGYDYIGVLEVPGQNLVLPVMSEWNEEQLRRSPCRYLGSAYTGDLIIAGHNYRRHFSNLKRMHVGDEVFFTDMDGNRFSYQVVEIEILNADAVAEMEAGEWDLTLFTCTYGGQTRFTVRCELQRQP